MFRPSGISGLRPAPVRLPPCCAFFGIFRVRGLNRLNLCFSKKLENLEAVFAMFAAYYNYCWQTRNPGKSGQKRSTAAMMVGIAGHVWSFDELFATVLAGPTI